MAMHARLATPADAEAMAFIYNQGIADRTATFETRPRAADDIRAWFGPAYPIVAVEDQGRLVAFAAASQWKTRECYRGIAELSVYVARDARRRGAGRLALEALIAEARRAGLWKLLGALLSDNESSRALMRACGFREVGVYERQAQLDGAWKDVVIVERLLPENQAPATLVIFACVHNAGRSQMAAAFFNALADPRRARAQSAGTEPAPRVHPEVRDAMNEVDIDLSAATPRLLTRELAAKGALLVTLGCGESCPVVPGLRRDDWPVEDPKGKPVERVRQIRDELRERVVKLLRAEGWEKR
jgi:L-amino acid N-acyltransferase YncA/protein-tyrosine-phosphatase